MSCVAVWHAHHSAWSPLEFIPSFEDRLYEIDTVKAREETAGQIARRKHLFKLAVGVLPDELVKAGAAYDQAWTACDQARAACDQARAAYEQAMAAYDQAWTACEPEIMALHAKECGCGWTKGRPNIFEYKEDL